MKLILSVLSSFLSLNSYANTLTLGQEAPGFKLQNQAHETISLSDYQDHWVVLYFYPKDETPGCTTEACSFRDNVNRLIQQKAVILGISLDDVKSHQKFSQKHNLPFNLLSDPEGKVAEKYGALLDLLVFKMAKRHSFIINPEGKIVKIYRNVDPEKHVGDVMNDLKVFQSSKTAP